MNFFDVLILSLVEGLTEFLPVSSTGHLIIASKLLDLPPTDFLSSFNIAIQLGAILAVVYLYGRRLWENRELALKVLVAFLPTALVGFAAYSLVKNYLLNNLVVTVIALVVGGGLIIWFEMWYKRVHRLDQHFNQLSYTRAFWLGLAQALSIVPGVSRSGATILAGLYLGLPRVAVVEFSFLLAIPTMAAATAYDLWQTAGSFNAADWQWLILGFILSFLSALAAVKWLMAFVKKYDFTLFGAYRIALGLFIWWLLLG